MHERQNQEACKQAKNFVNELPLLLSFTSPSEISGSNWGSCLRRSDTPFDVRVERSEHGMKGFESLGSIAIPPMIAQKLCVIVHGCRLERAWFSGLWCYSTFSSLKSRWNVLALLSSRTGRSLQPPSLSFWLFDADSMLLRLHILERIGRP